MKLIVLCGPENSGKTTILKMVYEEVKKYNLTETNWFKYYDDNCEHNDFRDVLVIKDNITIGAKSIQITDFANLVENLISSIKKQNYEVTTKQKKENGEETIVTEKINIKVDDKLIDFSKVPFEQFIPENQKDLENKRLEQKEVFNKINLYRVPEDIPTPISNFDGKKVGFILEGDFGFISPSTSWWTKHPQNLYTHLKNLEECDVIICACSILHGKSILQQPLLCLIQFIYECISKGTLTGFYHKNTPFPLPNDWRKRMVSNKPIVDWIKSQI
ncbi:MAG: hypothetical protein IJ150_10725 [Bacteroidales bacterium]|nr:hypothetical protein [Bacteroidales bacterium]